MTSLDDFCLIQIYRGNATCQLIITVADDRLNRLGPTGNGSGWGFLLHNALM